MPEIPDSTCCLSTSQSINPNWQSVQTTLQTTIPYQYLYYKDISTTFRKDNTNMLKDTLLNNFITNSPPKNKPMNPQKPTKELNISDYQILDTIGKGACGFVKLAKRKEDGKKVIIKYVVKSLVLDGCWIRDNEKMIPYEIHILRYITENFPHPYILRLLNTWEDHYYYYLEFESENVIDLFECIDSRRFTTEAQVKRIFYQIAQAVQHLHHINIVHRDIKDENILIRLDNDTVELIDFGSSAYVTEGKKFDKFCGTGGYAAPEVLKGQKYDGPPQDIWSLGILLYTMIYGSNPFRTLDQIITSEVQFPVVVSPGSHDLMCQMLNRDHTKRPTIDKVLAHPWFDDLPEKDKILPAVEDLNIQNSNSNSTSPIHSWSNETLSVDGASDGEQPSSSITSEDEEVIVVKDTTKEEEERKENEEKNEEKEGEETMVHHDETSSKTNEKNGKSEENSCSSYISEVLCKKLESQSISNDEGNLSDSTLIEM